MATISNMLQPQPTSLFPTSSFGVRTSTPVTTQPTVAQSPLITPPSQGLVNTKPAAPQAPLASAPLIPGTLTQDQLNAQNASRGISQINTGPAQVGGAVGSSQATGSTGGTQGTQGLFPSVLSSLAYTQPQTNADLAAKAQEITSRYGKQQSDLGLLGGKAAEGFQTGLEPIAQGKAAISAQNTAQTSLALSASEQNELAGVTKGLDASSQTTSALTGAGGLIPEALRYGISSGTNGGTNSFDPNTAAQKYASEVASGARTYNDAVDAMGLYGSAGKQFLDNAIRTVNPNFNFAQAQALASTQGTVAPNLNMANQALNNLQDTFANTPWYQKFGAPVLNSFTNMLAGFGVGTGSETSKQNAIKEARTNVSNALGTMTNTTPSAWTATVEGWFPDNASPDQVQAGIQQFATLAGYRQQLFGSPGTVQPYSNTSGAGGAGGGAGGGSLFSW